MGVLGDGAACDGGGAGVGDLVDWGVGGLEGADRWLCCKDGRRGEVGGENRGEAGRIGNRLLGKRKCRVLDGARRD